MLSRTERASMLPFTSNGTVTKKRCRQRALLYWATTFTAHLSYSLFFSVFLMSKIIANSNLFLLRRCTNLLSPEISTSSTSVYTDDRSLLFSSHILFNIFSQESGLHAPCKRRDRLMF